MSADPGDIGVEVNHKPNGRGNVDKVICVDLAALDAHLNHGDTTEDAPCTVPEDD